MNKMNRLIPGVLFSARAAREQRRRAREMGDNPYPGDVRDVGDKWIRAAQGFRKYDPDGRRIGLLFNDEGRDA